MATVLVRATLGEAAGARLLVAGLTVLERALRQARRMGHDVIVAADGSCPLPDPLPAGASVRTVSGPAEVDDLLRTIDAGGTFEAPDTAARARAPQGLTVIRADVVRARSQDLSSGELRVKDEASRRAAEDAIFAELLRGDLGFVARHFNKPVSFRITRHVLCHLPITPNQVTIAAGVLGLCGAALIASGRPFWMVGGFLLAHVQSVLDGCDGELARVRFQQSAIGEWLDTIVDDALNFVLFSAIGVGAWRAGGTTLDLAMGLGASACMLVYNAVAYRELRRQGEGGEVLKIRWWFTRGADLKSMYAGGQKRGLTSLVMATGRRDFFLFAWVLLALAGQHRVILVWAALIALGSFVVAMGQLALGAAKGSEPPKRA